MSQRILVREAGTYIYNTCTFDANNLRAILPHDDGKYQYTGGMASAAARQYYDDQEKFGIRYIVLSYDVPIAWTTGDPDVRRCPKEYYSATTTQHQEIVRRAWSEYF